jgi:hypothetical protein
MADQRARSVIRRALTISAHGTAKIERSVLVTYTGSLRPTENASILASYASVSDGMSRSTCLHHSAQGCSPRDHL